MISFLRVLKKTGNTLSSASFVDCLEVILRVYRRKMLLQSSAEFDTALGALTVIDRRSSRSLLNTCPEKVSKL